MNAEQDPAPYRVLPDVLREHFENADINSRDPTYPLVIFIRRAELSAQISQWVQETFDGLMQRREQLERAEGGTGGTYLLPHPHQNPNPNLRRYVSVFKPRDEEPRTMLSDGWIGGIMPGRAAAREEAAYLLDHPTEGVRREGFNGEDLMGFAGVPPSMLVYCIHSSWYERYEVHSYRAGALQKFMESDGNCHDIGEANIPVEEVHKICLLDLRFANVDRHFGNILYRKGEDGIKLIPIDHGFCFPQKFTSCRFDWLNWNKSQVPFNQHFISYIESLNAEEDINILRQNRFDVSKFARPLRISTMLLKQGVNRGLTPFQIGHIMCRDLPVRTNIAYQAITTLAGREILEESILGTIVSEAIESVVREQMGEEPVTEEIIRRAREESELNGMTREEFEEALLETVRLIMESKLIEYARELQVVQG